MLKIKKTKEEVKMLTLNKRMKKCISISLFMLVFFNSGPGWAVVRPQDLPEPIQARQCICFDATIQIGDHFAQLGQGPLTVNGQAVHPGEGGVRALVCGQPWPDGPKTITFYQNGDMIADPVNVSFNGTNDVVISIDHYVQDGGGIHISVWGNEQMITNIAVPNPIFGLFVALSCPPVRYLGTHTHEGV